MKTRLPNQLKAPSPSSVLPVQKGLFQSRSFSDSQREEGEALESSHQPPDLQTQLERASRFGHHFSRVQVQPQTPAVMQPQLDVERSQEQDEQDAKETAEPVKLMAPPLGKPIQREAQEEEPIQMMPQSGFFTSLVQREATEEEPIQMMPQASFLTSLVQREATEEEPIQMMPHWAMLQRSTQEEDEQPMQMMPQWSAMQRQEAEAEEEPIQMIRWLQPKVVVGTPGDKYEQEADSVAAQVMSMSAPPANAGLVQRQGEEQEQEPLVQRLPLADSITPLVQRQTEEQEEAIQTKSLLQRAGAKGNSEVGSDLENKLSSSKGGGSPLPDNVRSFMEPRFGTDFSSVRVHTDSTAVQMNKELGAQAFTHGSNIYYGAGKSPGKDELTAHELTHVVQQNAGTVQPKPHVEQQSEPKATQAADTLINPTPGESSIQPRQTEILQKLPYKKLVDAGLEPVTEGNVIKLLDKKDKRFLAEISDGTLKFKYPGFGGDIVMDPNKITTVLGKFAENWKDANSAGTRYFLGSKENPEVKGLPDGTFSRGNDKNPNNNGMNFLDIPEPDYKALINKNIQAEINKKFPNNKIALSNESLGKVEEIIKKSYPDLSQDELKTIIANSIESGKDEFWKTYNYPFLEDAFKRGDNIRLISNPKVYGANSEQGGTYKRELDSISGAKGLAERYGYTYSSETATFRRVVREHPDFVKSKL